MIKMTQFYLQVVLCYTNFPPRATCKVLFHEMTHAFDDCRAKVDFTKIEHLACTEVGSIDNQILIDP